MFTFSNSFHNTEARSKYSADQLQAAITGDDSRGFVDKASPIYVAAARVKRALCPVTGCTCGDAIGRRG